ERNFTYQYLMGVSGAAFRLQVHPGNWEPSSPHADLGFPCGKMAVAALPYDLKMYRMPVEKESAYEACVASINNGIPAFLVNEENGLVVGYADGGKTLLGRSYFEFGEPGFKPIEKLPWVF